MAFIMDSESADCSKDFTVTISFSDFQYFAPETDFNLCHPIKKRFIVFADCTVLLPSQLDTFPLTVYE